METGKDAINDLFEKIGLLCCMEFEKDTWIFITFLSYVGSEVIVIDQESH